MSDAAPKRQSFVVFPLGARRFALRTEDVLELSRAGEAQPFPQTTPGLGGVLLRRGEVLPVWDLASRLGAENAARKFWLITRRNFAGEEPTAVPVSGECQMLRAQMQPPPDAAPEHVRGVLVLEEESVEVLDLARLGTPARTPDSQQDAGESERRSSDGRQ
jgi:chemotaxis signal transduction protein